MRIPFQLFLWTMGVNLMFGLTIATFPGFTGAIIGSEPTGLLQSPVGQYADTSVFSKGSSTTIGDGSGVSWHNDPSVGYASANPISYTLSTIEAQNLNVSQSSTGSGYVSSGSAGGGLFNSVFDLNNVFLIAKMANFIFTTLYGIPILIQGIFGTYLGNAGVSVGSFAGIVLWSPIEAILIILCTVSYALGIAWFWTGRNVVRESL